MHTGVRICSQITERELHIQIEQLCLPSDRQRLMNGTNRNCVDRDTACGTATSLNFSEPYLTTPPMFDQSSDPPDYRPIVIQLPNVILILLAMKLQTTLQAIVRM